MFDDVLVTQVGEHVAFGHQAVVVRQVAGHLEDELFLRAIFTHQKDIAG